MAESNTEESIVWSDRLRHFGLPLSFTKYYIEDNRLYSKVGFFKSVTDEIMVYRILDVKTTKTLGQKLFGVGTVVVTGSDKTNPTLELKNIKNPDKVHKLISSMAEKERNARGIHGRELLSGGYDDYDEADDFDD